jgi:hypothetical protein
VSRELLDTSSNIGFPSVVESLEDYHLRVQRTAGNLNEIQKVLGCETVLRLSREQDKFEQSISGILHSTVHRSELRFLFFPIPGIEGSIKPYHVCPE